MGYAIYWLDPRTGHIGAPIQATNLSWSIELNKTEELELTVHKPALAPIPNYLWTPPTGGVLLTHTDHNGVEHPIVAGPITDWGTETQTTLQIKAAGLRYFFENRTIRATLEYRNTSLGQIAWNLAQHGMDRPGGGFPLRHGTPDDTGDRQRTYERWNVANNLIGKRWRELSNVINGPDIMIRPQYVDDTKTRIEWLFVHGTEAYPFIAQTWQPDFDTTAAATEIADITVTSTAKGLANRIWCTGAGEGEGTAIAYAEDPTYPEKGHPSLEAVITDSDQANTEVLHQKAAGALATRQAMIDQVTIKAPAASRKAPLGTFFVGDTASVTLTGWLSIPAGTRNMRIIKMSGGGEPEITIDFQEAQW